MIKPLNNHCLIEVIDEYDGIVRNTDQENVQKGVFRYFNLTQDHLTSSTGFGIASESITENSKKFRDMVDKVVYWQEYADAGSKFDIDGKKYVLIPWYRIIGMEE